MIWDILQQYRIATNHGEIQSTKARVERTEKDIEKVEPLLERFERLILLSRAMWEILHEKMGVSEEEFFQKVREIDLRDGKLDGKVKIPIKQCTSCTKIMNRKHMACIYCGAERLHESIFDTV